MLRRHSRSGDRRLLDTALLTLDHMDRGGIHDQLGGGFHRYSVDATWSIPHFEKMLYDNAQLARVYLHAHQVTGDARWRRVTEDVLDHALRELRLPGGGFASSQDADSPGGEGSYFVWTPEQLHDVLGDADGSLAARIFGVTDHRQLRRRHDGAVTAVPVGAGGAQRRRWTRPRCRLASTPSARACSRLAPCVRRPRATTRCSPRGTRSW